MAKSELPSPEVVAGRLAALRELPRPAVQRRLEELRALCELAAYLGRARVTE